MLVVGLVILVPVGYLLGYATGWLRHSLRVEYSALVQEALAAHPCSACGSRVCVLARHVLERAGYYYAGGGEWRKP